MREEVTPCTDEEVKKKHGILGDVNTFRRVFDTSWKVKVKNNYRGTK